MTQSNSFLRISRVFVFSLAVLTVFFYMSTEVFAEDRINAYWIHGNSIEPEYPQLLLDEKGAPMEHGQRKGWGQFFYGSTVKGSINWFHISIPTPVIEENTRVKLIKVFVLFKTIGNAKITDIHVRDGDKPPRKFEMLGRSGDHLNIDSLNTFVIDQKIDMVTGLNIAVRVDFGPVYDETLKPSGIQFSAAGADFYRSW